MKLHINCKNCGKRFQTWTCRVKEGRLSCSLKCDREYRIKNKEEYSHAGFQKGHKAFAGTEKTRFKKNPKQNSGKYKRITYNGKRVREHNHIWIQQSEMHFIPKGWVVHHINGIKDDNRIENLACIPKDYHAKMHYEATQ